MESLGFESLRPLLATGFLVLLWIAEGAWPMFLKRGPRGRVYLRNLALGLFNAIVVSATAGGLLLLVTESAARSGMGLGLLHLLELPQPWGWVAAFLLMDLWQYCWHRLNHRVRLLWRFHAVHHSDAEMNASTAVRFHTGEILLSSAARFVVFPLLGLTMEAVALYELIALPVTLFHHANIRMPGRLDKPLRLFLVTPWMHWVHHSRFQPETDSNYATVFSFWDRIFGSFRLREDPTSIEIGLDSVDAREAASLRGMLLMPLHGRASNTEDTPLKK
ncbi:MAG: hypothetical protein RLZZ303_105 [Candidatus Hydrogenedentota bacterium]